MYLLVDNCVCNFPYFGEDRLLRSEKNVFCVRRRVFSAFGEVLLLRTEKNFFCVRGHGFRSGQPFADAPHGFLAVFVAAEGGEADEAFAAGAEAYAGCAYHVGFVEHLLKETP